VFDALFKFEKVLSEYTGAPYAVVTDGCTHAIELCMRYEQVKSCKFTAYTYLSIPQLMHQLYIEYELVPEKWTGEYQFYGTRIWDSARLLQRNMYRPDSMQCLSFGFGKPLHLGKVGAVLLDDVEAYDTLSRWRSDGRDLHISPWEQQTNFSVGYHYCPTLEDCLRGTELLENIASVTRHVEYPDLRNIQIN
jgi:dTDP-4-amino-4,6-dideoxygalactose transaminase